VANGEGKVGLTPSAIDGMNVAAANAAALNLDLDIKLTKGLGVEPFSVEGLVRCGRFHLETFVLVIRGLGHGFKDAGKLTAL
jgi:hypothetical protein